MTDDRYPILVERYRGKQGITVICLSCRHESLITPDDLNQDGEWDCFVGCGGTATFKYTEADHKCPNCGRLGFFPNSVKPNCSRVCMLQTEYAQQLAARKAAA
jgi:rubrerythrin